MHEYVYVWVILLLSLTREATINTEYHDGISIMSLPHNVPTEFIIKLITTAVSGLLDISHW